MVSFRIIYRQLCLQILTFEEFIKHLYLRRCLREPNICLFNKNSGEFSSWEFLITFASELLKESKCNWQTLRYVVSVSVKVFKYTATS